jgi:hypothetical protein
VAAMRLPLTVDGRMEHFPARQRGVEAAEQLEGVAE